MAKVTKIDGDYVVLDADEFVVGTVEQFTRWGSLKQWRYRLLNTGTALDGEYVALANTRREAVEQGVEFFDKARTLQRLDERLLADLLKRSEKYGATCSEQDFRRGEAYRLLGAMDYIAERLVEEGGDSQVLGRLIHRHANREDWQVKEVAV